MAHPRKHSRLITVGEQQFRWHVDVDDDGPREAKKVSVFPADAPNGACLAMSLLTQTVLPSLVSRLIKVGTRLGYEPYDRAKSMVIFPEHVAEIQHDYPRQVVHNGSEYTWTPASHGGLHVKVRRSDVPDGQLLATFVSLEPRDLTEGFVTKAIDAALGAGWKPGGVGLDCHWLEGAVCRGIVAEMRGKAAAVVI